VKDSPYNVPGDLWTMDMASGGRSRLIFHKQVYSGGVWSHDGARIAYSAGRSGDTVFTAFNEWAGVFSPDMRWVAYVSLETKDAGQIFVRPYRISPARTAAAPSGCPFPRTWASTLRRNLLATVTS
jgi:Tol biopolymer transport system component